MPARRTSRKPPPAPRKPGASTLEEFCRDNRISLSFYFKLRAQGKGAREMAAGRRRLISDEAGADWRREREADARETSKAKEDTAEVA
jgi:hypothetical protein